MYVGLDILQEKIISNALNFCAVFYGDLAYEEKKNPKWFLKTIHYVRVVYAILFQQFLFYVKATYLTAK